MEAIPLICAWWWCPVPGASGILSIGTDSDAFTQTLMRVRTKRVFYSPELGFSKNNTLIPQDSCGCNKGFCAKAKPRVGIPNSLSDPQQAQLYVLVHTNRGGDKNKRSQKLLLCLHLLRLPASFSGSLRECFTRAVSKKAGDSYWKYCPNKRGLRKIGPNKKYQSKRRYSGSLRECFTRAAAKKAGDEE